MNSLFCLVCVCPILQVVREGDAPCARAISATLWVEMYMKEQACDDTADARHLSDLYLRTLMQLYVI